MTEVGVGGGGAAEHPMEVAPECGALEVHMDGLGLAGEPRALSNAEAVGWQAAGEELLERLWRYLRQPG